MNLHTTSKAATYRELNKQREQRGLPPLPEQDVEQGAAAVSVKRTKLDAARADPPPIPPGRATRCGDASQDTYSEPSEVSSEAGTVRDYVITSPAPALQGASSSAGESTAPTYPRTRHISQPIHRTYKNCTGSLSAGLRMRSSRPPASAPSTASSMR